MASVQTIHRKSGDRYKVIWRDYAGRQKTQTFRRIEDARRKAVTVEADKIRGLDIDTVPRTLAYGTLAEEWMRGHVHNLTPKVRGGYRAKLDRQLLPYWAAVRVERINAVSVGEWVDWCMARELSPWTIREAFTAMSASLGWAVAVRRLKENPLRGLRGLLPNPPRPTKRTVLEPGEILRLAGATSKPMYRVMVLLLGCSGMRPGELLALRVEDLTLTEDVAYAYVTRSVVVGTDGRMVLNEFAKTGQDRRVDIIEPAKSALISHLTAGGLQDADLLFSAPRAGGFFYESYLRAIVVSASETCGFERVVPYGLRHSFCVNGIRFTHDIEYVARQMGHRNVLTTLSIYNKHVTSASRARSVKALEDAFVSTDDDSEG